jgi:serine/threonine protein kinase/tetratricopeptide (TPR) repeat protein
MKLSRELWLKVGPLFDIALEMAPGERPAWLEGLRASHPDEARVLDRMLATHERAELVSEMETVPKLAPPPTALFGAGERIGPFRLLRLLGRGGMGEVWLAEQADGRVTRQVALKLPTVHERGEVWGERFRRERDILAKLAHPNIARLYDAGADERGQPWLAMEYVEGESIAEYMDARRLPVASRLALFRQVLAAVAHAHRHLVVHRDLKPANILVDASGQVKLLDFGIAKLVDDTGPVAAQDITCLGGRVMTIRYAAPEQAADGEITTATDIYSLGVILHELAVGASPYRAVRAGKALTSLMLLRDETGVPSTVELPVEAAARRGAASPRQLSRLVSGDLDAIILKAMRRDPAARYASVEHLDDDIARHLDRRPVRARAGTWRYLAGRFALRHKLPLAMSAAVLATMVVGLAFVERARQVAVAERSRAERHFASVRKLANTFIFDVYGELETLPGSLPARGILVKTSLEYLDALAGEAGGDPSLLYELASAYRKIGSVQGQPGASNTGDLTAAAENFGKAKRLLVAADPALSKDIAFMRERTTLSYLLARAHVLLADPRWHAEIAETVALAQRTAALPGATPRDRARVAGALAEQANLTGIMLGQSADVEAMAEKAIAILEALAREFPGDRAVQQNLASTHQRAATILTGDKRTSEGVRRAAGHYRKAIDTLRALVAESPGDERLPKLLLENLTGLAGALVMSGEAREAEAVIAEALAISARNIAQDPHNAEVGTDRLAVLGQAALVAQRAGNPPRAVRHGREALAMAARLPESVRASRDVQNDLAEAKSYLAFALLASAGDRKLDEGRRRAMLLEGRGLLIEAKAFLEEARAKKMGAFAEEEAREIDEALARCDTALAGL